MAEEHGAPLRIAVVGMSISQICGARDHATLLAAELARGGAECSTHWLLRTQRSLGASRSEIHGWLRDVSVQLREQRPDVVLLHYSVFSYAHAGLPLFAHALLRELRRSGVPVITVLHEYAYPWRRGGLRGAVWALTQRVAFAEVMRASAAALATTDARAQWVGSRSWLTRRPVAVAPVFSNLPAASAGAASAREAGTLGLFGYSYDPAAVPLVLDALRSLLDQGYELPLELLGAPGSDSSSAQAWREAAQARGLEHALSFSGTLSAQELADALAACEVLMFVASAGPSSRKGTLAASLASGRPVVAIDGPNRWEELARSGAALVVAPTALALADAVGGLLADEPARAALGARARAFSQERMSVARSADVVRGLIAGLAVKS